MIIKITNSALDTIKFAEEIGKSLYGGDIIAYKGEMGAGKTTFTRGLATGLGIHSEVASPTFAIVNEYKGEKVNLYHFDMYRIMNEESLETTGFYDYLSENAIIVIEWFENISSIIKELNNRIITIKIDRIDSGDARKITVWGDERFDTARD